MSVECWRGCHQKLDASACLGLESALGGSQQASGRETGGQESGLK